jgi:hypothetical protein
MPEEGVKGKTSGPLRQKGQGLLNTGGVQRLQRGAEVKAIRAALFSEGHVDYTPGVATDSHISTRAQVPSPPTSSWGGGLG